MQPDYNKAKKWILETLAQELPGNLVYHGLEHTTNYVLPAVERLYGDMAVSPEEQILLKTAALFHDSGFTKQYNENEAMGVALAQSILPSCGYSPDHLRKITPIILATTMPQQPKSKLDKILCDADLVSLGLPEFFETSMMLRRETETFLQPISLLHWLQTQFKFLEGHHYFTSSAREWLDPGKKKNLIELRQVIHHCGERL
jgi:predicted metal-dependent HD superfamily phosphohydrolase